MLIGAAVSTQCLSKPFDQFHYLVKLIYRDWWKLQYTEQTSLKRDLNQAEQSFPKRPRPKTLQAPEIQMLLEHLREVYPQEQDAIVSAVCL